MHKLYYKCLQGCFWMMYSASFGYLTGYLGNLGFSDASIGLITAGFGLLGILLQPLIGKLADNPKRGWKKLLTPMVGGILLAAVFQLVSPNKILTGYIAGFVTLIEGSMLPLVNQACFACSKKGDEPDFGSSRGMGSITYAVVSTSLGFVIGKTGFLAVPVAQIIIGTLMLFVVIKLPCVMHEREEKTIEDKTPFFKKYPTFIPVFTGLVFLMLFHCTTTTYMVKITNSDSAMGIALSISAIAEIPVMFAFGYIRKYFKINTLLVWSGVFFIVKGIFYIFSKGVMGIYIGQCFQLLSFAVYANAIVFFAKENVKEEDATRGQAYMALTSQIGTVVGSLLGGLVLQYYSVKTMSTIFTFSAVLGTVILLFYAINRREKKNVDL